MIRLSSDVNRRRLIHENTCLFDFSAADCAAVHGLPAHALAAKKDDLQIFPWFEGLTWDMSDAVRYVYIKERKGTVDISVWT